MSQCNCDMSQLQCDISQLQCDKSRIKCDCHIFTGTNSCTGCAKGTCQYCASSTCYPATPWYWNCITGTESWLRAPLCTCCCTVRWVHLAALYDELIVGGVGNSSTDEFETHHTHPTMSFQLLLRWVWLLKLLACWCWLDLVQNTSKVTNTIGQIVTCHKVTVTCHKWNVTCHIGQCRDPE